MEMSQKVLSMGLVKILPSEWDWPKYQPWAIYPWNVTNIPLDLSSFIPEEDKYDTNSKQETSGVFVTW